MSHRSFLIPVVASALLASAGLAKGEADGPDCWQVTGVATNDVLNMRVEPNWKSAKVGEIPHNGIGLRNLGCEGGLTYKEHMELTEEQQQTRLAENPRWCKIEYRGIVGWVNAIYLVEGACAT